MEGDVGAFFWSPDGHRLAVAHRAPDGGLVWLILDVASGRTIVSAHFIPSTDYVTLLTFFDQYAYSHSPWSADSSSLVFSGRVGTVDAVSEGPALVYVLNAAPGAEPMLLAEGGLAFWIPPIR